LLPRGYVVFILLFHFECLCFHYVITSVYHQKEVFNGLCLFAGCRKNPLIEVEYRHHGDKKIVPLLGGTEIASDTVNAVLIHDSDLEPDSLFRHEIGDRFVGNLGGDLGLFFCKNAGHIRRHDKEAHGNEAQKDGKAAGPKRSHRGLSDPLPIPLSPPSTLSISGGNFGRPFSFMAVPMILAFKISRQSGCLYRSCRKANRMGDTRSMFSPTQK